MAGSALKPVLTRMKTLHSARGGLRDTREQDQLTRIDSILVPTASMPVNQVWSLLSGHVPRPRHWVLSMQQQRNQDCAALQCSITAMKLNPS